jgi:hypothetical protein
MPTPHPAQNTHQTHNVYNSFLDKREEAALVDGFLLFPASLRFVLAMMLFRLLRRGLAFPPLDVGGWLDGLSLLDSGAGQLILQALVDVTVELAIVSAAVYGLVADGALVVHRFGLVADGFGNWVA